LLDRRNDCYEREFLVVQLVMDAPGHDSVFDAAAGLGRLQSSHTPAFVAAALDANDPHRADQQAAERALRGIAVGRKPWNTMIFPSRFITTR